MGNFLIAVNPTNRRLFVALRVLGKTLQVTVQLEGQHSASVGNAKPVRPFGLIENWPVLLDALGLDHFNGRTGRLRERRSTHHMVCLVS